MYARAYVSIWTLRHCDGKCIHNRSQWTSNADDDVASHGDVLRGSSRVPASLSGPGTRDEPLRTSAWDANDDGNEDKLLSHQ